MKPTNDKPDEEREKHLLVRGDIHMRLKRLALDRNISILALVERLILDGLKREDGK